MVLNTLISLKIAQRNTLAQAQQETGRISLNEV